MLTELSKEQIVRRILRSAALTSMGLWLGFNLIGWSPFSSYLSTTDVTPDSKVTLIESRIQYLRRMISSFEALKEPPAILLIGSSVMTLPMSFLDMDEETFSTDRWLHRDNFEVKALKLRSPGEVPAGNQAAFDMSFTGAMISDSYLMTRKYVLAGKKPEWLVLGVIPRDVMDTRPSKTLQFSCLPTLQDWRWVKPLYLPTLNDKIEFFLNQFCFFHTYSWWVKGKAEDALHNLPIDYPPVAKRTIDEKDASKRWQSSIKEYRGLYKRPRKKVVKEENVFLYQLGHLAASNKIRLLIINMPLPVENRELLPRGFYQKYTDTLKNASKSQGAVYLDLGSSDKFARSDFFDSSHLNRQGALKLCEIISDTIESGSKRSSRSDSRLKKLTPFNKFSRQ
jgi:hypothetical protein